MERPGGSPAGSGKHCRCHRVLHHGPGAGGQQPHPALHHHSQSTVKHPGATGSTDLQAALSSLNTPPCLSHPSFPHRPSVAVSTLSCTFVVRLCMNTHLCVRSGACTYSRVWLRAVIICVCDSRFKCVNTGQFAVPVQWPKTFCLHFI